MKTGVASTFLERLKRSELLTSEQVALACAAVGPEEPHLSRHLVEQGLLTRFQARQLRAGATRFKVEKYVVVDYIGHGGHGIVYKARHTLLPNRHVALKMLDASSLHKNDQSLTRFRHEVEIVSRLDHPNIVRAYDVIEKRSQLYLVLEYVEGSDLAKQVSQFGPLPIPEAADYALQATRGLAYAHRRGIVHRDVKPANLLLAQDGVVKLADLGLAQVLAKDDLESETIEGITHCTPGFMAPEQAERADQADVRGDLYSLGATLYHLLTAAMPVKGRSYLQCLQNLLTKSPPPVASVRPEVPPELAALVDRLLSREPADRPASADEVMGLLEPFARVNQHSEEPAQWDGRRKAALVLDVLQGRKTAAEACTPLKLPVEEFERWQQKFLEGGAQALSPASTSTGVADETLRALYAKIGVQAMEIETLKNRAEVKS
jgi:serine/threonine protein kinase